MSTKIYQGFIIENKSIYDFIATLSSDTVREAINNAIQDERSQRYTERFYELVDCGGLTPEAARDAIVTNFNSAGADNLRRSEFDVTLVLAFKAMGDHIYLLNYTENGRIYQAAVEALAETGIKEYQYYDNADHPETLTDQEWDHRREMWFKVIDNISPESSGFLPVKFGGELITADDLALDDSVTVAIRAERYARDRVEMLIANKNTDNRIKTYLAEVSKLRAGTHYQAEYNEFKEDFLASDYEGKAVTNPRIKP